MSRCLLTFIPFRHCELNMLGRFQRLYVPEPNTGCWLWTGALDTGGYGRFNIGGEVLDCAHRVSFKLFKGKIPDGYDIDHLCRVRCCVNPDHLEAVTRRENLRRSSIVSSTIKANQTHCIYGHEFTASNVWLNAKGHRVCKKCKNRHIRDWKRRERKRRKALGLSPL